MTHHPRSEIIFSIVEFTAAPLQALVIALEEAVKDSRSQFQTAQRKRKLYHQTLMELATQEDKDLIISLLKEEMSYCRACGIQEDVQTKAFDRVRVKAANAYPLLRALAASRKLFYRHKPLVCDLLSKNSYFFYLQPAEEGKVLLEGMLKIRDREVKLKECSLIACGPPHWFILDNYLGVVSGNIEWRWLKQAFAEEPFLLSERKVEDLFDEKDLEEHLPEARWKNGAAPEGPKAASAQPMPFLKLADRTGAFADLWMDYGEGRVVNFHSSLKNVVSKEGSKTCVRDLTAEKQWEKDLLETDFAHKIVGDSHYYCPVDKVSKSLVFLLECGWPVIDAKGRRLVRQLPGQLYVESAQEAIIVKGKVPFEGFEADLKDVAGAFNRRERFVDLSPGLTGILEENYLEKAFGGVLQDAEIVSEGLKIRKSQAALLADVWSEAKSEMVLDETVQKLCSRFAEFGKGTLQELSVDSLPESGFHGSLRAYQQQGLSWLCFLKEFGFHGILADDMGLGKTVQVLAFLSKCDFSLPVLIVAPTSLLFNWRKEIERFLPGVPVVVHHGPGRAASAGGLLKNGILLTSYTLLRADEPLFTSVPFDVVVLDEAQAIKNAETRSAKAACALQTRHRLCVTGTPLENSLLDVWSQFHFLMPGLLGKKEEFQKEMAAAAVDARYLQRLKKKVRPFMLRRTKQEVAKELPEKIEQVVWVEMAEEQRAIYEEFLQRARTNLLTKITVDGMAKHRMEVFETILRLRQICCHPRLVGAMLEEEKPEELVSGKWQVLLDDLETIVREGRKALIYSQFTTMLQLIAAEAKRAGWSFAYLDGSTVNREEVVRGFQEDPGIHLFFISLKAGGVGLNLTSADYVFLYDPWWNEAAENQAIDRAHRIGRVEPVIAKRLVMAESIEEKMMTLKASKRSMIEQLWEGEAELGQMTEEDLKFLLS